MANHRRVFLFGGEMGCKHHWIIEQTAGAEAEGQCYNCGEIRTFINRLPQGIGEASECDHYWAPWVRDATRFYNMCAFCGELRPADHGRASASDIGRIDWDSVVKVYENAC
jgi:hypothetical protein